MNIQSATPYLTMGLVLVILTGVVYIVIDDFKASVDNTSTAYAGIENATSLIDNIVGKFGLVGTMVGIALVVGVLGGIIYVFQRFSGGAI